MTHRFVSKDPRLMISNEAIKKAADNPQFVVVFHPKDGLGLFETPNPAVAEAIQGLIDAGRLTDVKAIGAPATHTELTVETLKAVLAGHGLPGKDHNVSDLAVGHFGITLEAFHAAVAELLKEAPDEEPTLAPFLAASAPAGDKKKSK